MMETEDDALKLGDEGAEEVSVSGKHTCPQKVSFLWHVDTSVTESRIIVAVIF